MKFDIEQLLSEHDSVSKEASAAAAQVSLMKDWKDIVKAKQMKIAEANGIKSAASQEREALCTSEYLQAINASAAAIESSARLKLRLRNIELSLETWRTMESSARLERKAYQPQPFAFPEDTTAGAQW